MSKKNLLRSRSTLILLFAIFLLPLVIAWLLNFGDQGWHPAETGNHGALVEPPRPLAGIALQTPDGNGISDQDLHGKWTLVYILAGDCTEICRKNLYKIRQVRLALGEDMGRVQRLMIVVDDAAAGYSDELREAYPGLIIGRTPAAETGGFLEQFQLRGDERPGESGRVYLVDPLGNLMMSYEADADPGGMVKDLERLLRISYVG